MRYWNIRTHEVRFVFIFITSLLWYRAVWAQCAYERIDGRMRVHSVEKVTGENEDYAVITYSFAADTAAFSERVKKRGADTLKYIISADRGAIDECLSRMGFAPAQFRRMYLYALTAGTCFVHSFSQLDTLGWMYPGCRECVGVPRMLNQAYAEGE